MRGRRSAGGRAGAREGYKRSRGERDDGGVRARYPRDEEGKGGRVAAEKEHQGRATGGESWGERIQKERKKEGNYARRDRQLPRNLTDRLTDSRNTRPASRCMRIFKIVCYIRELLTVRFAPSSTPRCPANPSLRPPPVPWSDRARRIFPCPSAALAPSNLRQPSLTHDVYARSPEVFTYMDRGVVRAYLLSPVAVMARVHLLRTWSSKHRRR